MLPTSFLLYTTEASCSVVAPHAPVTPQYFQRTDWLSQPFRIKHPTVCCPPDSIDDRTHSVEVKNPGKVFPSSYRWAQPSNRSQLLHPLFVWCVFTNNSIVRCFIFKWSEFTKHAFSSWLGPSTCDEPHNFPPSFPFSSYALTLYLTQQKQQRLKAGDPCSGQNLSYSCKHHHLPFVSRSLLEDTNPHPRCWGVLWRWSFVRIFKFYNLRRRPHCYYYY